MIIAGAFLVLWCVGIIMLAIPPIFWHPIGHYICWGIIWGGSFVPLRAGKPVGLNGF
jgi:hypothetical protein